MLSKRLDSAITLFQIGNCKWAPYSEWSECSKPCDGGSQNRTRTLQQTAAHGGVDCVGESTQFRDCNLHGCPGMLIIRTMMNN